MSATIILGNIVLSDPSEIVYRSVECGGCHRVYRELPMPRNATRAVLQCGNCSYLMEIIGTTEGYWETR